MNNYIDDEYGSCPNCGAFPVHISQLGEESGVVCYLYCFEQLRRVFAEENTLASEIKVERICQILIQQ